MAEHTGAPTARHPIVKAALALSDFTPDMIEDSDTWRDGLSQSIGGVTEGSPRVTCSAKHVTVHFERPDRADRIVFYMYEDTTHEAPPDFWVNLLEFRNWMPPETIATALPGRTLETFIDLPGAQGIRILDARKRGGGLVLTLAHQDTSTEIRP